MDYIFDWARDVYRTAIICELRLLAANNTSSLGIDSDIVSLANRAVSWLQPHQTQVIRDDEGENPINQEIWSTEVTPDVLKSFDSSYGALRDATYIRSRFMALYVTEDNLSFLLKSMETPDEAQNAARSILQCLKDSWRVSSEALDDIELIWTDEDRTNWESPQRGFYVTVTLSAYLSIDWEQTRELCYLAVSEGALKELFKYANLEGNQPWLPFDNPWIENNIFVDSFTKYLSMGVKQNLLAAVSRASVSTKLLTDLTTPKTNEGQTHGILPDSHTVAREFVSSIYNVHKIGRNEPSSSIFRISSRLDQQHLQAESSMKSIWPGPAVSATLSERTQNTIFVTSKSPSNGPQVTKLCIFIMDVSRIQDLIEESTPEQPDTHCKFQAMRVSSKSGWVDGWNRTDMQMHDAGFLETKSRLLLSLRLNTIFAKHV